MGFTPLMSRLQQLNVSSQTWRLHVEKSADSVDDVEGLGNGQLLQGVAVRGGDICCRNPQDRSVQVVKCCT